ncbi:MAG: hypothetical protein H0X35_11575 [Pseudonocardiales bacterium]|nr:hypothetical protein [Pseudonocardiales bacterium]
MIAVQWPIGPPRPGRRWGRHRTRPGRAGRLLGHALTAAMVFGLLALFVAVTVGWLR